MTNLADNANIIRPVFIQPTVASVRYLRGEIIVNNPVNIALCMQIRKGQHKWYPDNEGIPAIMFDMIDGTVLLWAFPKGEHVNRDTLYNNLLSEYAVL